MHLQGGCGGSPDTPGIGRGMDRAAVLEPGQRSSQKYLLKNCRGDTVEAGKDDLRPVLKATATGAGEMAKVCGRRRGVSNKEGHEDESRERTTDMPFRLGTWPMTKE
ncbi:uncharacterized protein SPSK_10057 [Sporothrix schenckii 1099-18]|uniref:Uncharacterized protein n=1 Tax=Sporothrix schenckii 1099-18 TaxID=1397361 RepID=A0A0F2M5N8_SPOSC|nr:uncharacterized protein SPSK_10057 [Sporothrix schenckii 1099-18]KJR84429.1 hypothetical protein SPSK_10057 [Sporothrix schenckii 1099-18]